MLLLLLCPDLRAADAEHKRTLAATEELGDGTRTFNYGPIFKLAHQHQSGSYLEELHDLRLCHPPWIKPFITRWHFCPVLNACTPWESDAASETWRVMDNPLLCKGWQSVCCGGRGGVGGHLAVTSRPCQPLHLADAFVSALPPVPDPRPNPPHLRWRTAWRREITHGRWGHLRWLAHPSIVSLSHVTYSCFVAETLQDRSLSVVVETQKKKGRGWGKADIASLRSSSKFSERAGIKRRTRLRANKSGAPPPHTHKKRLPCTPTVPLTTFLLIKHSGPPGGDKKKRPSQQKCMQRKCAYKGH